MTKKIALLLTSLAMTLAFAELVTRLWPGPGPKLHPFVFITGGGMITDVNGVTRYPKSSELRELAVYEGRLEYTWTFETNRRGFIQQGEPSSGAHKSLIAFVGDSFMAGQGGTKPWFYDLERNFHNTGALGDHQLMNLELMNLGVPGTGFLNFKSYLFDVHRETPLSKVVIVFITEDLSRRHLQVKASQDGIHLCEQSKPIGLCSEHPYWRVVPRGTTPEDVVLRAQALSEEGTRYVHAKPGQRREQQNDTHRLKRILESSRFLTRLTGLAGRVLRRQQNADKESKLSETRGLAPAEQIVSQFGKDNVLFIQLPQKEETSAGSYSRDSRALLTRQPGPLHWVDGLEVCGLEHADYHLSDSHPNHRGYAKIQRCVLRAVRRWLLKKQSTQPAKDHL